MGSAIAEFPGNRHVSPDGDSISAILTRLEYIIIYPYANLATKAT